MVLLPSICLSSSGRPEVISGADGGRVVLSRGELLTRDCCVHFVITVLMFTEWSQRESLFPAVW